MYALFFTGLKFHQGTPDFDTVLVFRISGDFVMALKLQT